MSHVWDDDFDVDGAPFPAAIVRAPGPKHPLGNPAEVVGFLGQGERWVSAAGPMDIADMTPEHALNTVQWVLANAQRVALTSAVAEPGAHFDAEVVSDVSARRYLLGTRLVQALIRRSMEAAEVKPSWAK